MDGTHVCALECRQAVDGFADYVEQTAFDLRACRNCYRTLEVVNAQSSLKPVGTIHGHTPASVFSDVLLNFKDELLTVGTVDFQCRIDGGNLVVVTFEDDIDNRSDHLGYFSEFVAHNIDGLELLYLCTV